jgi:hypothetical protein
MPAQNLAARAFTGNQRTARHAALKSASLQTHQIRAFVRPKFVPILILVHFYENAP